MASFALNKLTTKYDVDNAVAGGSDNSFVASDRSGNVYMMNGEATSFDVLRMTPQGKVSRFARIAYPSLVGVAATSDGGLLFGGGSGLIKVNQLGAAARVQSSHHFDDPKPIGARADGSAIILDGASVWSLKDGKASRLYGQPSNAAVLGTVDTSGTAYVQLAGSTFADMLVLSPGRALSRLRISGQLPGGHGLISELAPLTITAAPGGGFYSVATSEGNKTAYLVHVQGAKASVLARSRIFNSAPGRSCQVGKLYPAFDNPCSMPWFAVQVGKRVLVMGSNTLSGDPVLAFAIRAETE